MIYPDECDEITKRSFFCPDYDAFISANDYIEEATRLRAYYASEHQCVVGERSVTLATAAVEQMRMLTQSCANRHWSRSDRDLLLKVGVL